MDQDDFRLIRLCGIFGGLSALGDFDGVPVQLQQGCHARGAIGVILDDQHL